jgi:hypothetical protein
VLQVAVRKSLAERAATGVRVRQLENFTAEALSWLSKPVADPETMTKLLLRVVPTLCRRAAGRCAHVAG